jgi:type IV pilus assembly protein PilM
MAKKQNYLGIDIGGGSLKVVELKPVGNRPQLVTYGYVDESYNIIKDDTPDARREIANHLRELLKQSRVTSNRAVSALPSFSVFSSIINLPAMARKDLISAVRWEAKKFVPIPLEEMILDWEVLKEPGQATSDGEKTYAKKEKDEKDKEKPKDKDAKGETAKGNLKVLLTAAPKNLVNRYVELFKEVGLQLVGLETESFALERSLVGNDLNPVMVVDLGSRSTSIIIFSAGVPILNRSIDVGGRSVTKGLAETMGLSESQAEQYKRDMSISLEKEPLEKLPRPVAYMINSLINEMRYILNIYQSQSRQPVSKVILTGGSCFVAGLTDYIYNIFNIKAFIGDPWARVIHPVDIDAMLKELGPRFAVSIGLAMREIG